jgi:hypothetical protein
MTGLNHNGEAAVYALNTGLGVVVSLLPFHWSVFVGPGLSIFGGLALAFLNYYLRKRQNESEIAYLLYRESREENARLKQRIAELEK